MIAVLAYHKVGDVPDGGWQTWFRITESMFAEHLEYLDSHGWHVLALPVFLSALDAPDAAPDRAALITFDDGHRSVREVALPHLERLGFPAVVFVPSDFIGDVNSFDAGIEPEEPLCDWDDLHALESVGVSVQSHGASHRRFSELDAAGRQDELSRSKAVLERGLVKTVEVFAFPYGDAGADQNDTREALRRSGYRAACLYGGGPMSLPIGDRYRLARIPIGWDTDLPSALAHAA